MGLLTPLYIAGLVAVSLPLVFHLIRRTPRGRELFGSLMFLAPSPPRITRRSRLDNVVLFLLRAAALTLVAVAFARPFLRDTTALDVETASGRRILLLIDDSASMRRHGIWPAALGEAENVLEQLRPNDRLAVFACAGSMRCVWAFDAQEQLPSTSAAAAARRRLRTIRPGWSTSDIGGALVQAADMLDAFTDERPTTDDAVRQIVLISDLQEGASLDALQSYQWPGRVRLHVHRVGPTKATNAALQVIVDPDQSEPGPASPRVRVVNASDSAAEQFQLRWAQGDLPIDAEPIDACVPPGESIVLSVPRPAGIAVDRLILTGDDHSFDNTYYVAADEKEPLRVTYLGADAADDRSGPRYFLELAVASHPDRVTRLHAPAADQRLSFPNEQRPHLVVVTDAPPTDRVGELQQYLRNGGTVLYVLSRGATAEPVSQLMQCQGLEIEEAAVEGYVLWSEIRFTHPLFAVFSHPHFNDFTGIHFWHYRSVSIPPANDSLPPNDDPPGDHVLARFDNGDPALLHQSVDAGNLYVLASGWHPADSQLARSSKFVPLVLNLVDLHVPRPMKNQYRVDEPVTLQASNSHAARTLIKPDGTRINLPADQPVFRDTDQPGLYRLTDADANPRFAVNVSASESRTAPLAAEDLEQFGVQLGSPVTAQAEADRQRRLVETELENRQKLWRPLIALAVVILLGETWLAGRLSQKIREAPDDSSSSQ